LRTCNIQQNGKDRRKTREHLLHSLENVRKKKGNDRKEVVRVEKRKEGEKIRKVVDYKKSPKKTARGAEKYIKDGGNTSWDEKRRIRERE